MEWIFCPVCGSKTRDRMREDTVLKSFPLFCHTGNDLSGLKQWALDAYTGEEKYRMQQAVRDQNIITANGTAALEFAREVRIALTIAPENKVLEWYKYFKRGCYEAPMPGM